MAADVHAGRINVGWTDSFFRSDLDVDGNDSGAILDLSVFLDSHFASLGAASPGQDD